MTGVQQLKRASVFAEKPCRNTIGFTKNPQRQGEPSNRCLNKRVLPESRLFSVSVRLALICVLVRIPGSVWLGKLLTLVCLELITSRGGNPAFWRTRLPNFGSPGNLAPVHQESAHRQQRNRFHRRVCRGVALEPVGRDLPLNGTRPAKLNRLRWGTGKGLRADGQVAVDNA